MMEMIKCPHCGAEIEAGTSFCQFCGAMIVSQPGGSQPGVTQQTEQPQTEQANAEQQPTYNQPSYAQQPPYTQQEPPYAQQQPPYTQPQQPPYGQQPQPPYGQPYAQQQPPYGQPPFAPQSPYGYEQKSRMAAGLLGIFLGGLGIHNFYLGYQNKALTQLLVCLIGGTVTCGVAAVAMYIWGLVEGIQILSGSIAVDAKGIPLKD